MASEQLTPYLERKWEPKLQNWALWAVRNSSAPRDDDEPSRGDPVGPSAYNRLENEDTRPRQGANLWNDGDAPPPPIEVDALDTDMRIAFLSEEHRDALRAWYVWSGSLELNAQQLGCHVNTLRNRRAAAIVELERLDATAGRKPQGQAGAALVVRRPHFVPADEVD